MKAARGGGALKLERKTVEKNRRIHMKNLCFKLTSLIPMSKRSVTQQYLLDRALSYVDELRTRVESLKQKKLEMAAASSSSTVSESGVRAAAPAGAISRAGVQLRVIVSSTSLQVSLICGSRTRLSVLREVIGVLEEEGAQVSNASFSNAGDKIFHTINFQAISPRIGLNPARVGQRLRVAYQRFCIQEELAPQGLQLMYNN